MRKVLAALLLSTFAGCFGGAPCRKCDAADAPRACPCGVSCPCPAPCLCAPATAEASAPANRMAVWFSSDGGRTWQFVRWANSNGPVYSTPVLSYATGARCVGGRCFR